MTHTEVGHTQQELIHTMIYVYDIHMILRCEKKKKYGPNQRSLAHRTEIVGNWKKMTKDKVQPFPSSTTNQFNLDSLTNFDRDFIGCTNLMH